MDKTWVQVVNLLHVQFSRGVWNPTWASIPRSADSNHSVASESESGSESDQASASDSASDKSAEGHNSQDEIAGDELQGMEDEVRDDSDAVDFDNNQGRPVTAGDEQPGM